MKNDPILGSLRGVLDPGINGKVGDFDPPKGVKKGQKWVKNDPFSSKNVKNHVSFDNFRLKWVKKGSENDFFARFWKISRDPPGKMKKTPKLMGNLAGFFPKLSESFRKSGPQTPPEGFWTHFE